MADTNSTVRVVDKKQYDKQYFFDMDRSILAKLAPDSVRIRAELLGLASYNLSYCAMGDILHWYDAYPLPGQVPKPFNDGSKYAVPPGWGYAKVEESTIEGLSPGTMLYGMLPTSSLVADLRLAPSKDAPSHWIEVSQHREQMMSLYKRYIVADSDFASDVPEKFREWRCGAFTVWQCGYLLNRYVFSAWPDEPVFSPFPGVAPWSSEDADVSRTVIFALASSSKTSRAFVQQLAMNRAADRNPLGLVEVTAGAKSSISGQELRFKHQVVEYDEASSPAMLKWVSALNGQRVVVIDFGGRGNSRENLCSRLDDQLPGIKVQVLVVGSAPKVYTPEELKARAGENAKRQAIQLNTSPIIEALMNEIGDQAAHDVLIREYRKVYDSETARNAGTDKEGEVLGLRLDVRKGVRGGLESAWAELCEGRTVSNTACVIAV